VVVTRNIVKLSHGERQTREDRLAVEAPLELRLGGKPMTVIMRTPGEASDEELAIGFLYGEGLIKSPADLLGLSRPEKLPESERGNVLEIMLQPPAMKIGFAERNFYSSASCGVCGKTSIASLEVKATLVASELSVSMALLAELPEKLRAAQTVFAQTGGLHASGLFTERGELQALREDVGRHNAVDKLVGWALRSGRLPLSSSVLVLSGRSSFELVQKAIMARIPLIAAIGAASSLAADLAERFGITLVGFLRAATMNVYTHPERII
jgi:FdhD protein